LKDRPAAEPPPPCRRAYDILIPIYNAYDHVKRCVESVLRHTEPRHTVYLLDDASPDARILPLLEEFAKADARVKVLPSDRNGGFIRNVNRGFRLSRRSVVILNSDTEVTPHWLERLDRCRESGPEVAVVSPLSTTRRSCRSPR
ncbi:MAG: glycosyltransferase family 2 protein, partial [Candidatus Methylomirabilis sp.]|nr:glycosyltransferase family 2 protein [Deltaproteobacteria bacterium]